MIIFGLGVLNALEHIQYQVLYEIRLLLRLFKRKGTIINMKIFPEGKAGKIFGVIFLIGFISLGIEIFFTYYVPPFCNPADYPFGSDQWSQCLSIRAEQIKDQERIKYATLSACENETFLWKDCYEKVAVNSNNLSICDIIFLNNSIYDAVTCYNNVGKENNNTEGCKRLLDLYRNSCTNGKNEDFCPNLEIHDYRSYATEPVKYTSDECYQTVAYNTKNQSICENIIGGDFAMTACMTGAT
jgi:hypothetical protein